MSESLRAAVDTLTGQIRELYIDLNRTSWDAATTGTPAALDASAQARARWMRFWADRQGYEQYRDWDTSGAAGDDRHLARMVRLLHLGYAEGQRDPATIDEMTELAKVLDDAYTNFRAEVDGQRLNENTIREILAKENDSAVRRRAWEASKQVGPRVADQIRRLAVLRNQAAHAMGYPNFHRMSLVLNELDPDWLYAMLDDLAQKIEEPFRRVKGEMDA